MKKKLTFIVILVVLALTSYNDLLDKYPKYGADPESEVTNEVTVALTIACYKTLQSSSMYNQCLWNLDILAGNSKVDVGEGTDELETAQTANFMAQSDNGFALYVWRSPWVGTGRCNIMLSNLPSTAISDEIKDRCMGEAYFLHTHYYYILVHLYGGVPLWLQPLEPEQSTDIARNTVDEVYTQILSDCKNAVDMLPPKSSYGENDKGRAYKETAMAMLVNIYLTLASNHQDCYSGVATLYGQITATGYGLFQRKYADNFDATISNGAGSLFEVQYSSSTGYDFWRGDSQSSWLSTFMGPRSSGMVAGAYGWDLPTEEFIKEYEAGDLYEDVTVLCQGCPTFDDMECRHSWSGADYNIRKFLMSRVVSPEYDTNPNNFVIYRYADIPLKRAEALNKLGHPDQAVIPLDIVRYRTGLADISTTLNQGTMREKVAHERRTELASEGHRWFDMIRINNGNYAIEFLKSIGENQVTKERLLLPIPQTEMDSNSLMTQNPGY